MAAKRKRRTAVDVLFGPPEPLPPFFKHYGSKWLLAKKLPAPRYDRIVEMFGGAGGYSCRWHDRDVTLIDIDPGTVAIWHYLQQASVGDIMALPGDLPREDFALLGKVCRALRGQVIAHEQEGADWLPFEPWQTANTGRAANGVRGRRAEYLWTGGVV